ncbi:MAG: hydrogenase nickel incorporation protein HypB [Phycisphaerae bacterium]
MCEYCGCGETDLKSHDANQTSVHVGESLLAANDRIAEHNREHFASSGVLAINLMGSPGSGKTAVLEATARRLTGRRRLAAIAGDLETDRDARRLRAAGIPSTSVTTGSACHLDAKMVHHALHDPPWKDGLDLLFIENVGNLVCPAIFDLGQAANVVALSITEGEDKPLKYPIMFRKADLVLLTKMDLHAALPEFDVDALRDALSRVMPRPHLLLVSARSGQGFDDWIAWLESRRRTRGVSAAHAHAASTHVHH